LKKVFPAILLVVLTAVLIPGSAFAQSGEDIDLDVEAGFDGYVQQGTWTPVFITVANDGADIEAELRISVANPFTAGETIYTRPVTLPGNSRRAVTMYVRGLSNFGADPLQVDLVRRGRAIATARPQVQFSDPEDLLVGLWSDTPQTLATVGNVLPPSEIDLAIVDEENLPDVAKGWDALDVLFISDADSGQLSLAQQEALEEWIASGGRLIVVGGLSFQRTASGVADILPISPSTTESVDLADFAESAGVEFEQGTETETEVTIGTLTGDAEVLFETGDTPLVVYRQVGTGRVDFVGIDPALEPFFSWADADIFWSAVLSDAEQQPGWSYGFNVNNWDISRQAVAAIPGVRLPSVFQLLVFLTCYVVLVGPINYLILFYLKKRELAWITIPTMVLIFSALAYVTGFQVRGSRPILHRLAVVQSWQDTEVAEVNALIGLWSPRRARYEINLDEGLLAFPLPRQFSNALTAPGDVTVEEGETVTLKEVRVDVGSIEPFVIEGFTTEAPRIEGLVELTASTEGVRIVGDVVNFSSSDLTNVRLVFAGTSSTLADLPAGEVLEVDTVMTGGFATPNRGDGLKPFPSSSGGYYGGYYGNSILSDLIGQDSCYSQDGDLQTRCNLVNSVINGDVRDSGIYLVGWSDDVPIETNLGIPNLDTVDRALHIVELDVNVAGAERGGFEVTPGLMTWQFVEDDNDPNNNYYTPYDLYITQSEQVAFRYVPFGIIPQIEVDTILLHIEEYYSSAETPPQLELFNVETGDYDRIRADWGVNEIPDAGGYVDALGGVTVRITGPRTGQFETNISRLDVTLIAN